MCVGLSRVVYICTAYDRIFGHSPAKNTVCTTYIYGVGQLYNMQYQRLTTFPEGLLVLSMCMHPNLRLITISFSGTPCHTRASSKQSYSMHVCLKAFPLLVLHCMLGRAHTHTQTHTHTHTHTYLHTHTTTCTYTHIHANTGAHTHTHTHASILLIQEHARTRTRTHTHTRIHSQA
jgi:hypothetical protein